MTQEEKQLLLRDLCLRLPYKVKCKIDLQGFIDICDEYKEQFEKAKNVISDLFSRIDKPYRLWLICGDRVDFLGFDGVDDYHIPIELVKPYLFPILSMTDSQREEYESLCIKVTSECADISGFFYTKDDYYDTVESIDYLYKNHIDVRGLISMGLAIDATGLDIY